MDSVSIFYLTTLDNSTEDDHRVAALKKNHYALPTKSFHLEDHSDERQNK